MPTLKSFVNTVFSFLLFIVLFSCNASRHAGYSDQKDLSSLIKKLKKRGEDMSIVEEIRQVYSEAHYKAQVRLQNHQIELAPGKWDQLIPELESLQQMYEIILGNSFAFRQVQPVNYSARIISARDSAAADYYSFASALRTGGSRRQNKIAYEAFRNVLNYVSDYRDVRTRMNELYNASIVHVLINPVEYDILGWGFNSLPVFNSRTMDLQSRLIQDLGGQSANGVPARFYTPAQLRMSSTAPDLVADMIWRNVQINNPVSNYRSYNRSRQVENGRDSANRPMYTTVYATVNIEERRLEASGSLHLLMNDISTRNQIAWDQLSASFQHTQEFASYTGDRRALNNQDWALINNRNQRTPTNGEVLAGLLENVYQRLQNRIRQASDW
jgi:hypothetical protein